MYSIRAFALMSLMVVFAMLMTAGGAGAKAPETGSKALTIAGVVFQDDQFMKSMTQGYEDAGKKYGIKILTANTNNDQAKEAELIQTYIAQAVDGIAIAPLSQDASIPNLKDAQSKGIQIDRKSTRLNSSHMSISYAVFCLKKKKKKQTKK